MSLVSVSLETHSLQQLQTLAHAAGFGAVFEDELDVQRATPPSYAIADARTGRDFVPGWHMPDAPAPRTVTRDTSRALTVVEPLWRTQQAKPAQSWAQHLTSVARNMSAYIPGRGVPA